MLPDNAKVFDVDAHLLEPPGVWLDRLPKKYQEACPHVEERQGHSLMWVFEGQDVSFGMVGSPTTQLFRSDGRGDDFMARHYDDLVPATYDPKARVEAMDSDGIWAQISFPSFPRFAGTGFLGTKDKELAHLCVRAYNDWVIEEWCAVAPERLLPLVILPLWDIELCVDEIERVVGMGARAVTFPEQPAPLKLPSFWTGHWDPLFAAIQEADVPICTHVGTQGSLYTPSPDSSEQVVYSLANAVNAMSSCTDLIFSGVFTRFGGLKFIMSEAGGGWVPYLAERMDYEWQRIRSDTIRDMPSSVLAKHFWVPLIEDYVAIDLRDRIGVDRLLLETDFPHQDSNWPNSRKVFADMMIDVPDDDAMRIAELNARELFKL
jgi:predicted TIM-barrel fold metal-dependent hydrolase